MKKFLRPLLCGGLLAAVLCTPSLAAEQGAAIPLLVNGEEAVFPDAAPVLRGDAIDVPVVATFQALGYEVAWDEASQTITASREGGTAVTLTIGENAAAGANDSVYLDQAPYVDTATWRTYIPADALDALLDENYRVAVDYGWTTDSAGGLVMSQANMAVIVDDIDAILAANPETYERMDQYMEYAQKYSQGTFRVNGSISMSMSDPASTRVDLGGDYNMLTNQTAMQFDTDLSIETKIDGAELSIPNMDMDLRCDLETGMLYFQSQAITASDTWYALDMKALYNEMYGPDFYEELLALANASEDMTFTQSLEEILKSDALPLTRDLTTSEYLEIFNHILGDSAFVKEGSTYTSTPLDLNEDGTRFLMTFQLYTSGGQVNGYGLEMVISDSEENAMTLTTEMRGNKMEMAMDFQMPGLFTMTMEIDGTYQSTSSSPVTEPPAGATVVDLMELLTGSTAPAPEPAAEA